MKKISLNLLLFFFIISASSQNTNLDYKKAIKIYNLSSYEKFDYIRKFNYSPGNTYYFSDSKLQVFQPTIAYQWKTPKSNFHEIELNGFTIGILRSKNSVAIDTIGVKQTVNGYHVLSNSFSARYEYILNFNKTKEKKLVPSIGFAINPYFNKDIHKPVTSYTYKTSETYMGFKLFLIPRITYYFASKFFLDLNIPICYADMNYQRDKSENPAIPVDNRTITTINFATFPKMFSGRIGLGLKL